MAIGDVFKIELLLAYADQQMRPGFYLVEGAGVGDTVPTRGAAQAVVTALGATPLTGFSAGLELHGVTASDCQPGTGISSTVPYSPTALGTVGEDNLLPPQNSGLIRWATVLRTVKGSKATRGRTYMPGLVNVQCDAGFLLAEMQDSLSAFASLLFDAFVTDGTQYQMFCVHFLAGSKPRTVDAIEPVVGFTIDNIVDTQRRRRRGRGI